jgi:hypothetical protein
VKIFVQFNVKNHKGENVAKQSFNLNTSRREAHMNTGQRWALAIANTVLFIGVVAVNGLANALPINDVGTGELSAEYPNLFVPAGITFSIWGIIYLLLAVYVIYALVTRGPALERVGWWFAVSCAANIAWIFAWHYRLVGLSVLIMLGFLAVLIVIYLRLRRVRPGGSGGTGERANSVAGGRGPAWKLAVDLPFSVYLGWITVATIANITALLVSLGWQGFGLPEAVWTIVMIVIAAAIGIFVTYTRADPWYGLVLVWAFAGIVIKRVSAQPLEAGVAVAAAAGAVLVLIACVMRFPRWLRR